MKIRDKILVFFVCAFACYSAFFYFVKRHIIRNDDFLIVGTASGYAPFVSINAENEYEGFDIDFARALADKMHKKLVIEDYGSMTSLFMALKQNKIDAIIWGLCITQDRLKKVAMIHYQGKDISRYILLSLKGVLGDAAQLEDMYDKVICVEPGSSQEAFLDDYKNIIKMPVEKIDDALFNIQYGKADGALVDVTIAKKFIKKYSDLSLLEIILPEDKQSKGFGIALSYKNELLIKNMRNAVEALKNEGIVERLEKKWKIND